MKTVEKLAEEYANINYAVHDPDRWTDWDRAKEDFIAGWRACRKAIIKEYCLALPLGMTKEDMESIEYFGEEEANVEK